MYYVCNLATLRHTAGGWPGTCSVRRYWRPRHIIVHLPRHAADIGGVQADVSWDVKTNEKSNIVSRSDILAPTEVALCNRACAQKWKGIISNSICMATCYLVHRALQVLHDTPLVSPRRSPSLLKAPSKLPRLRLILLPSPVLAGVGARANGPRDGRSRDRPNCSLGTLVHQRHDKVPRVFASMLFE